MPVEADRVPVRPFSGVSGHQILRPYGQSQQRGRYMWPTLLITSNKVSCIAIRRKGKAIDNFYVGIIPGLSAGNNEEGGQK